jgi:sodium-dependent dicarboxylate transporter 2/3/5
MAMALEKYNLHQKVALKLLQYIGARPKMLMLGFMLISFFISMWISNTATTSLMVSIADRDPDRIQNLINTIIS